MFVNAASANKKGSLAEIAIAKDAVELGFDVMFPMTEHGRYDLGIEIGGRVLRAQCKWARKKGDVIQIRLGTSRHTPLNGYVCTTYPPDEVDVVAAHCGNLDRCYLIPIDLAAEKHMLHLRLAPPANGHRVAINYAADYEFPGAVAQLARAIGWQPVGRGFESHQLHLVMSRDICPT